MQVGTAELPKIMAVWLGGKSHKTTMYFTHFMHPYQQNPGGGGGEGDNGKENPAV